MSLSSRREYLAIMQERYRLAAGRKEKSQVLDEIVATLDYNRKYATRVLRRPPLLKRPPPHRQRTLQYLEALPAIQLAWEALDYPCAERLHPVLLWTAEQLASHGELSLTGQVQDQLRQISRATLARRLARMPTPKVHRMPGRSRSNLSLRAEVPLGRYHWDETRPGAVEIDLVEHNGGSSAGHFACTLDVVDVATGWSGRRAVLGRGQAGVFAALQHIVENWPFPIWAIHSDNGQEFINQFLIRFCRERALRFTRSRPYKKNDNPHVEQKNRQFVRDTVGYARYDTPQHVDWLNHVYACLDPYANLFLPTRKVVAKTYLGPHLRKAYDVAKTPFHRLCIAGALDPATQAALNAQITSENPLALHRRLQSLLACEPVNQPSLPTAAD